MTARLYFESHITIDPVFDEQRDRAALIVLPNGFLLAKLFMLKDGSPHDGDTFMTCRTKDIYSIKDRTLSAVQQLERDGFHVRRWKIELAVLDSKSGDSLEALRRY